MHFLQQILWSNNVILILSYGFESLRFSALVKHFLVSNADFIVDEMLVGTWLLGCLCFYYFYKLKNRLPETKVFKAVKDRIKDRV